MRKINYLYKAITAAVFVLLIASCNDCPLQDKQPVYLCETRIVTIEKFNPNFTITPGSQPGEETVTLDPDYNISIYEFPNSSASSGSLPNDNRFKGKAMIPVASVPFVSEGNLMYANYMDSYPVNSELNGDILVRETDMTATPPSALLRIAGRIAILDQGYLNEDAQAFCDYVKANENRIETSFKNYGVGNIYGMNQPGATRATYDAAPIVITDQNFNIIGTIGQVGVPMPPQSVLSELLVQANTKIAVDLSVLPGNVYTYIAKNGKRFVFFITEIRQTTVPPNRKRVTIMLYPLDK